MSRFNSCLDASNTTQWSLLTTTRKTPRCCIGNPASNAFLYLLWVKGFGFLLRSVLVSTFVIVKAKARDITLNSCEFQYGFWFKVPNANRVWKRFTGTEYQKCHSHHPATLLHVLGKRHCNLPYRFFVVQRFAVSMEDAINNFSFLLPVPRDVSSRHLALLLINLHRIHQFS